MTIHCIAGLALTQAVRGVLPEAEINEAEDMPAALAALNKRPDTDLVLLDLQMPCGQVTGSADWPSLRAFHPGCGGGDDSGARRSDDDPVRARRPEPPAT